MDKKIIALISVFTIFVIGIAIIVAGLGSPKAELQKTKGANLQTSETNFNFNNIRYSGGNVSHKYEIRNAGDKDLRIANLATSCMCTTAYFKEGNKESPVFGMKGMSAPSNWTGVLKPGETGEIVTVFDPSYHGLSGIGPIQRTISFETNDPDRPYVELSFNGVVVK